MPIHDVGYRPWNYQKSPVWTRWLIIAQSGIRLTFKSKWIRRVMLFAWLPVLFWASAFFGVEQMLGQNGLGASASNEILTPAEEDLILQAIVSGNIDELKPTLQAAAARKLMTQGLVDNVREEFENVPFVDDLLNKIETGDAVSIRHAIWSWMLLTFFRYPQGFLILFLVGFIAPSLISRDIRSRAFLLYFSKPIGPLEYVLGKSAILATFIIAVTSLPALVLYLFAVMLSPDLSVVFSTWDIPLRVIASTVFLVVPTTMLALMLSSLTQESRFASFAWFAIWALGHGAWYAVLTSQCIIMGKSPFDPEVLNSTIVQQWSVISLYNNLGDIQNWVFGFSSFQDALPGIAALGAITLFSTVFLFRRINANIRV